MIYLKEPRVLIEWQDGETALKSALRMEKKANTKFMTILNLALEKHDPHVSIYRCFHSQSFPSYSLQTYLWGPWWWLEFSTTYAIGAYRH